MLVDARTLSAGTVVTCDVAIIGAGAAGITIAREFIDTRTEVCVFESGGTDYSAETQMLAQGGNVGLPYFDLRAERIRALGGCTGHWGGDCRPLDPIDFATREWLHDSGWPFGLETLKPYYERATQVLRIKPYATYDVDRSQVQSQRPGLTSLRFAEDAVELRRWQQSGPLRFGEAFRDELERAANVTVYLNANLVRFGTNDEGSIIDSIELAVLQGPRFTARARLFILATGTIENARLLLGVPDGKGRTFGARNDLIGRYFQEHPAFSELAMLVPAERRPLSDFRDEVDMLSFGFTEAMQRRHELLNSNFFIEPRRIGADPAGVVSLRRLSGAIRAGRLPDDLFEHISRILADFPAVTDYTYRRIFKPTSDVVGYFEIGFAAEQAPNPDSRVRLGDEVDALGIPRVELDWQLADIDRENIVRTMNALVQEVGKAGLGRIKLLFAEDASDWREHLVASHHQMGTTRMHPDPKRGVVDENCRTHGVANLYVAGGSVFPTSGASSPTFTIVALALRLADHLKEKLA